MPEVCLIHIIAEICDQMGKREQERCVRARERARINKEEGDGRYERRERCTGNVILEEEREMNVEETMT